MPLQGSAKPTQDALRFAALVVNRTCSPVVASCTKTVPADGAAQQRRAASEAMTRLIPAQFVARTVTW